MESRVKLRNKQTGEIIEVWAVDAAEIVAVSGDIYEYYGPPPVEYSGNPEIVEPVRPNLNAEPVSEPVADDGMLNPPEEGHGDPIIIETADEPVVEDGMLNPPEDATGDPIIVETSSESMSVEESAPEPAKPGRPRKK